MDMKFLKDRIESYKQEMIAVENTSEQYALLYQAYSVTLKRYYIQRFPQQVLLVTKAPGSFYDNLYKGATQRFVDDFMRRYLTQINEQPNS